MKSIIRKILQWMFERSGDKFDIHFSGTSIPSSSVFEKFAEYNGFIMNPDKMEPEGYFYYKLEETIALVAMMPQWVCFPGCNPYLT